MLFRYLYKSKVSFCFNFPIIEIQGSYEDVRKHKSSGHRDTFHGDHHSRPAAGVDMNGGLLLIYFFCIFMDNFTLYTNNLHLELIKI